MGRESRKEKKKVRYFFTAFIIIENSNWVVSQRGGWERLGVGKQFEVTLELRLDKEKEPVM